MRKVLKSALLLVLLLFFVNFFLISVIFRHKHGRTWSHLFAMFFYSCFFYSSLVFLFKVFRKRLQSKEKILVDLGY